MSVAWIMASALDRIVQPQNLLLLVGALLLTMGLMMRIIKRRRRGLGEKIITPGEHLERTRQARGMRGDLEELMVEIEQLAKRFSTQLDAKSMQLEQLIVQADQRIAELKQMTEQQSSALQRAAAASTPSVNKDLPQDPLSRSVYQLADEGKNSVEIAHALNEHVGKVELILALRNA